jgi:prepilin-type processing-associated H-X9-DG protein
LKFPGNGRHRVFTASMIVQAETYGLAADGWMCPNGWHWGTVDPEYELKRIDWTHDDQVNFLWGDFHVAPRPQKGASVLIRSNPLYRDPLHTGN